MCNQCTRGFYYSLDEQCVACPFDSTDCPADGGSTQEVITIKPGYWRASATGQSFLACPIDDSCVGGTNFTDGGDGYCAKGHTGVLCAVCDDDYFYDKDQNVCSRCSNAAASQSLWTALCALVALSSAYVLWRSKLAQDTREASVNVFKRTKQKLNITAIMMQIATSMPVNLGIVFPVLFSEFLGAFDFVNINPFQVIAFNCVGTFNFYHTLLGMTLTPLAVCGLLMGRYLYKKKMVAVKEKSEEEATAEEEAGAEETKETEEAEETKETEKAAAAKEAQGLLAWTILILFFTMPPVSSVIFSVFKCRYFEDSDEWYLVVDYSIQCEGEERTAWLLFALIMVLIYPVGITVSFGALLYSERHKVNSWERKGIH